MVPHVVDLTLTAQSFVSNLSLSYLKILFQDSFADRVLVLSFIGVLQLEGSQAWAIARLSGAAKVTFERK